MNDGSTGTIYTRTLSVDRSGLCQLIRLPPPAAGAANRDRRGGGGGPLCVDSGARARSGGGAGGKREAVWRRRSTARAPAAAAAAPPGIQLIQVYHATRQKGHRFVFAAPNRHEIPDMETVLSIAFDGVLSAGQAGLAFLVNCFMAEVIFL